MSTISVLASQSVSNEDGIKQRLIQRLKNAMYANQIINVGDNHPIDLLAHYQLGIEKNIHYQIIMRV